MLELDVGRLTIIMANTSRNLKTADFLKILKDTIIYLQAAQVIVKENKLILLEETLNVNKLFGLSVNVHKWLVVDKKIIASTSLLSVDYLSTHPNTLQSLYHSWKEVMDYEQQKRREQTYLEDGSDGKKFLPKIYLIVYLLGSG